MTPRPTVRVWPWILAVARTRALAAPPLKWNVTVQVVEFFLTWRQAIVSEVGVLAAGPAAPCGPVAPCGPCAPVWPLVPLVPLAPGSPGGPVAPCGPAAPWGPAAPVGPCGPGETGGPVSPTECSTTSVPAM